MTLELPGEQNGTMEWRRWHNTGTHRRYLPTIHHDRESRGSAHDLFLVVEIGVGGLVFGLSGITGATPVEIVRHGSLRAKKNAVGPVLLLGGGHHGASSARRMTAGGGIALLQWIRNSIERIHVEVNPELMSVTVQAAATIVAVVAGFITGVVLNLSSKREGLTDQISTERERLDLVSEQEEELRAEATYKRVAHWLDSDTEEILKMNRSDPGWAWRHLRMGHIDEESFAVAWKKYVAHLESELQWLNEHIDRVGFYDADPEQAFDRFGFDYWAEHHARVDPTGRDEHLLSKLFQLRRLQVLEAESGKVRRTIMASSFSQFQLHVPAETTTARQQEEHRADDINRRQVEALLDRAESAEAEMETITLRLKQLGEQLAITGRPPAHLALGFWLMVGLAISGITIPMVLINFYDHSLVDWATLGLFNLGLTCLFAYMAVLIFPDRWQRLFAHKRSKSDQVQPPCSG